ncbi:MAG TPA: hypothetical protein VKG78_09315 [Opitutaceae bacterium]|nr:hypothetical protein [Opitutaceae bacterium]
MRPCRAIAPLLLLPAVLQAQLEKVSDGHSILGRRIEFDPEGRVLPWYEPAVPGAAYDHVVRLASDFLLRRCPVEPKTGLPMYLATCGFSKPDLHGVTYVASNWANNPACIFAGAVQSFAVGYYGYTGDPAALSVVGRMLDYELAHGTTPAGFAWPGVPYASADPFVTDYQGAKNWEGDGMRGDGLNGIEPDKVGELGYGYARFFEITQDPRYLQAALRCADALAAHVRDVNPDPSSLSLSSVDRSPWPFRVNAQTGAVISEYCSNALDPTKLFDELLRIANRVALDPGREARYRAARDLAWKWLFSKNGPMKTFIWNAYFEDVPNDPARANRLQITPCELAKYLIRHPGMDKNADADVATLIRWVATVFKADGWDAINEQTWCYEPMGSHTSRYGAVCAMFYERTGDPYYRDQAYRFLNYATYMALDDGYVAVGPNWPSAWWSDGYTDYVRHYLDALGSVPDWAPAGENHLLRSSSVVQSIVYGPDAISLATYDASPDLVFRLAGPPAGIVVSGKPLVRTDGPAAGSYSWRPLGSGGVLRIAAAPGNAITVALHR